MANHHTHTLYSSWFLCAYTAKPVCVCQVPRWRGEGAWLGQQQSLVWNLHDPRLGHRRQRRCQLRDRSYCQIPHKVLWYCWTEWAASTSTRRHTHTDEASPHISVTVEPNSWWADATSSRNICHFSAAKAFSLVLDCLAWADPSQVGQDLCLWDLWDVWSWSAETM